MIDNAVSVTRNLLNLLNIRYTKSYLEETLLSHPNQSSLLAISDTLNAYKVENLAIKVGPDKLLDLPTPFITQIKIKSTTLFYVVESHLEDQVSYYADSNVLIHESRESFLNKWTGVCLLIEKSLDSKEPDIEQKITAKRLVSFLTVLLLLFLFYATSIKIIRSDLFADFKAPFYEAIYFILKIVGLFFGVALLWYEVDKYNPRLQAFCSGGNRVSCNSVLNSKYASIFNGTLSLSLLGFTYFFASVLFLWLEEFSFSSIGTLTYFSFATFPIIVLSLYYQAFQIKQWCKFCLGIQVVLALEISIGYIGRLYNYPTEPNSLPLLFSMIIISILTWKFVRPLLDGTREIRLYKRGLKRIKNNPDVLDGLLRNTRKINVPSKDMGITIDADTAQYDVIKVCNPYCPPCAKAHPILEELVDKGKINLQILFNVSPNSIDVGEKPVRHLLAINDLGDQDVLKEAMNQWYLSEDKDYDAFADNYPMNGKLVLQDSKIRDMRNWCKEEEIKHTPTIFINGHELPDEYSIADLTEVLN